MKLHVLNTGYFKLDGGAMFGVVPKSIWNKLNPADENNLCNWAMRCLLIEQDKRLILVDTGIGDKQDEKFFGHYHLSKIKSIEQCLQEIGFTNADITDVFLTHLHFDHVGGAIMHSENKLIPAFPNAIYWSSSQHWEWANNPNDREKASFLKENIVPIMDSGKLKFVEEGTDFNNIKIRFVHGHTMAMMLPQISFNNKEIVYMADLLPSTGHIPLPYVMAYDMFPLTTLEEKTEFLEEAVDNDFILFFEHDPVNECCTLERTPKGIRKKQTFNLNEI